VTVAHRGTLRSTLMTAHEIGHAVHAVVSAGRQPPGTLVGEAIACLAAVLVAGQLEADALPAAALACGDHLIDEIHLSAAASLFEDAVHDVELGDLGVSELDALWLAAIRGVYEPAVNVPEAVGTDWARHPSFVASPGHAVSYVWANLFALTVTDRALPDLGDRMADAMRRGAIDADEFLDIFDVTPDHLVDVGLAAFAARLERLAAIAFT
jgi:oligoendopeptidase F